MVVVFICLAAYLAYAFLYPTKKAEKQQCEQAQAVQTIAPISRVEPVVACLFTENTETVTQAPAEAKAKPVKTGPAKSLPQRFQSAEVHPWTLAMKEQDSEQEFYETLDVPAYLRKALAAA